MENREEINHTKQPIVTTVTTQLVVLTLLFFGGEVIFDFALTLAIGFVIGTYSSWFVASPIVVEWEERRPSRFK